MKWLLALILLSGCATLTPKGSAVKVVGLGDTALLKKCKDRGFVMADSEQGKRSAVIELKNVVGKNGANVVLSNLTEEKSMGWFNEAIRVRGKMFDCSEPILSELTDISLL